MSGFTFARGGAQAAVAVMLEAAQWLESRGMPLWTREEIERLPSLYPADAFLVLYDEEGQPAAAALLTDADPLFWPHVPPHTTSVLHKLYVRRAYAGKGLALRLLDCAAELCKQEGLRWLRLDCDASREKLRALYLSAGFSFAGEKQIHTNAHGTVTAALFERTL